ncbi:MAG TPA: Holliday junction resolvase RuvX [Candidatus Paceibacterota bacterium]|nr:Holliday junction resolvase RuvX [Candidatus Paceibacterota bacterium]
MRFLGIDFGSKRIGLAVSDEEGKLAFPKEIVLNDKNATDYIKNIIKNEKIDEIVIGESLSLTGEENKIMGEIKDFVKEIFALAKPVHFQKEFFTSVEARGREGKEKYNARKVKKAESEKTKKIDDSAAALILQRYLDKINKK